MEMFQQKAVSETIPEEAIEIFQQKEFMKDLKKGL